MNALDLMFVTLAFGSDDNLHTVWDVLYFYSLVCNILILHSMREVRRYASFSVRKVEFRKIQLYTLKRCDDVLHTYYKKYCSPRAGCSDPRACRSLGA